MGMLGTDHMDTEKSKAKTNSNFLSDFIPRSVV